MSTRYVCDYPGCSRLATFRLIARAIWQDMTVEPADQPAENGVDVCNEHYEFTHPGKAGGAWWDDYSAPQTGGKKARVAA